MTDQEKILYHQIHPIKLGTDWSTGLFSLYLLWRHKLGQAILVMFLPAIVVSALLLHLADLEPYKQSWFGHYVRRNMTPAMQGIRLLGVIPMALGAWYHRFWLIALGILITLFGWLRGLVWPKSTE